jgi:imidazole glycerol-phosphate synthase subunit HisH
LIAVLDYGIGNLRSAQKALEHVGADARLVTRAEEAEGAAGVVLPGVGAFGACMKALRSSGLDAVAHDAVDRGIPFLGVCVGMQLLYEGSDESPDERGLGILDGRIRLLPDGVKRPQMQWNRLEIVKPGDPLLSDLSPDGDPWVYFVHSYAAEASHDVSAYCDYGGRTVAAVARGDNVWATQFHPEKSGVVGLRLLKNFVDRCTSDVTTEANR